MLSNRLHHRLRIVFSSFCRPSWAFYGAICAQKSTVFFTLILYRQTSPVNEPFSIRILPCFLLATAFLLSGALDRAVAGASTDVHVEITDVRVGHNGFFRVGRWSPVVVRITTSEPAKLQLLVTATDPDGSPATLPGDVVTIDGAGEHDLRGMFRSGRIEGSLTVEVAEIVGETSDDVTRGRILARRQLHASDDDLSELKPGLTSNVPLVAVIGKPAGMGLKPGAEGNNSSTFSEPGAGVTGDVPFFVAMLDSPNDLADEPILFDSLDVVIIVGRYDLNEAKNAALREWVRCGGHLVVSVGNEIEGYQKSPLSNWIPIRVTEQSRLRDLSGIESYVGKNAGQIIKRGSRAATAVKMTPSDGTVIVSEIDGPVLTRSSFGFGQVTFLALDLDRPPLSDWPATSLLVQKLISESMSPVAGASLGGRALTHSGITDLATQLRAAQEQFPSVDRLSTWAVMALLATYLLVIGPVDYLLVHYILRRPQLTWVTFPVTVLIAVGLALWGAVATNGSQMRINQIDLVDVDGSSQMLRSKSWLTVYGSQTRRYRVDVRPTSIVQKTDAASASHATDVVGEPVRVTWNGIPEEGYGGMYRPAGFEIARPSYTFARQATGINDLPISIWSTKNLEATWIERGPQIVESDLRATDAGQLTGTIKHHLIAPIEDWMVAFGKSVYHPMSVEAHPERRKIMPGSSLAVSSRAPGVQQRELAGYLIGLRRSYDENVKTSGDRILMEQDTYDPSAREPGDILRTLTFHSVAGGSEYTHLENNALRALEHSDLLRTNRAVLFGRISTATAAVSLNGESKSPDRHSAYVRIVLPVKAFRSSADAGKRPDRLIKRRPIDFSESDRRDR